jgi:hypothetical protein
MLVTSGKLLVFATVGQFKNKRLEITCEILPLSASTKMSVSPCNIFTLPGCLAEIMITQESINMYYRMNRTGWHANELTLRK